MPKINPERWAIGIFIVLAIGLRIGTFFPAVINHDESTYIMIGQQLLDGQTYLVDAYDTKPIGIFLIYALLNLLTGGSIFGMRLLTAAIIGLTAYLLFRLGRDVAGHARIGWAAGISYIIMCSLFTFYGISPNTELFFIPFTLGAIYLAWPRGQQWYAYIGVGLLLGCAFMIKYVTAGDALALGLILLGLGWQRREWWKAVFHWCLPMTVAFFVPFLLVWAYYVSIDQSEAFFFYTFEVTGRYPEELAWWRRLKYMGDFLLRYFPLVFLGIFALLEKRKEDRTWQWFLLLWFLCDAVILLLPGKTFGHYQIQLMPPLALLAASWFHPDRRRQAWLRRLPRPWGMGLLTLIFVGLAVVLFDYYGRKEDPERTVSQHLQELLEPGEKVYTGNYHHIVNHIIGQQQLTPYVHSSLLFYDHHIEALEIDIEAETERILEGHHPRYVLLRTDYPVNYLSTAIMDRYTVIDTLVNKVLLLER